GRDERIGLNSRPALGILPRGSILRAVSTQKSIFLRQKWKLMPIDVYRDRAKNFVTARGDDFEAERSNQA
ncbi:hypothetical protein, partial [Fulvivirga sediminis]|uniref:hypothetical protein n=1 Tax=Fulvivirga sediminis TaxID=2803949 RepID=UPI001F2A443A